MGWVGPASRGMQPACDVHIKGIQAAAGEGWVLNVMGCAAGCVTVVNDWGCCRLHGSVGVSRVFGAAYDVQIKVIRASAVVVVGRHCCAGGCFAQTGCYTTGGS